MTNWMGVVGVFSWIQVQAVTVRRRGFPTVCAVGFGKTKMDVQTAARLALSVEAAMAYDATNLSELDPSFQQLVSQGRLVRQQSIMASENYHGHGADLITTSSMGMLMGAGGGNANGNGTGGKNGNGKKYPPVLANKSSGNPFTRTCAKQESTPRFAMQHVAACWSDGFSFLFPAEVGNGAPSCTCFSYRPFAFFRASWSCAV